MNDWYTRQEVAELLGVSKATVYHYAKQKKIIKIEDPHRLFREARYEKEAVDALAEERKRNTPTGWRPSQLANELNVSTQRIYTLIRETDLPVKQLPAGDERMVYSIPDETAAWIRKQIENTTSSRGTRVEFYDARYDIALYQLFKTDNGKSMRVVRNAKQAWGFQLPSGTWIPYADGRDIFQYAPAYTIHQENQTVQGYTDFILPTAHSVTFEFLDVVYESFGIENIRIREQAQHIALSIKSGVWQMTAEVSASLIQTVLDEMLVSGKVLITENEWNLISGYRRTTFDLPTDLLDQLRDVSKEEGMTMSEYVEGLLEKNLTEKEANREDEN